MRRLGCIGLLLASLWPSASVSGAVAKLPTQEDVRAAREALAATEGAAGPGSAATAAALESLAYALVVAAPPGAEAEELARRAIAIRRAAGEPSLLAKSLIVLGRALMRQAKMTAARAPFEEALGIAEKARDDAGAADALLELAKVAVHGSDYVAARAAAERAVELREELLGPNDLATGGSLEVLGRALTYLGEYERAGEAFRRALAVLESHLDPEDPRIALVLGNYGTVAWFQSDFAKARSLYERALAIAEKTRGPKDPMVAGALINVANASVRAGDHAAARGYYERALAIEEETYGPTHPDVALVLVNLGVSQQEMGEVRQADATFRRALGILESHQPEMADELSALLLNMGALAQALHDPHAALPLLERAKALAEKTLGPDNPELAANLGGLAVLQLDLGNVEAARPLAERALALQPDPHRTSAEPLQVLARIALQQGNLDQARLYLDRALAAVESALGSEHAEAASIHELLGGVDLGAGDAPAARRHHERALAIREKALGPAHPSVAESLEHLAAIFARDETTTGMALDAALRAEAVTRDHLRDTARGLPERRVLSYALARTSGLDWALTLLAAGRPEALRREREIFDAVVRSRCLVFDEVAARQHDLAVSSDPAVTRLLGELELPRTRWAWLSLKADLSPEEKQALESTGREKDRLEQALAQASSDFHREWERSRLGLDDVQRALPGHAGLVSFVRYERQPLTSAERAAPAYLAFVLGADGETVVVPLGAASEIEPLVDRWRTLILEAAESGGHGERRSLRAYFELAGELRRRVWDPVAAHLNGAQQAFLTADGALHRVSWAALPSGEDRFLVETGPHLHVLSTERDLVAPPDAPDGRGLLVMGAPDFDRQPPSAGESTVMRSAPALDDTVSCARLGSLRFRPLPGADREVREVGEVWRRRSGDGKVVSLRGAAASEAAFKRYAPGSAGLHLATHGVFLPACPDEAAPSSSDRVLGALLRSAVVFAGANLREAEPGVEDGILTAEEVAALNLRGVQWVVLSACESGIGDVAPNEGVFGLRRAFQLAGAETVIASLWPVEDEPTRKFMQRLYAERLEHGASTVEAVRLATLSSLAAARAAGHAHPFYWAGLVAVGGWR